jgi:endonuclease/exonuclease/phosphatase family metal-dependent hydrolase
MHRILLLIVILVTSCSTAGHHSPAAVAGPDCRTRTAAPVSWVLPPEPARHDDWCAAVGPALVTSPSADGGEEIGGPVDSLLVVSWNLHVGGGELRRLAADLRSGRLTGEPARHFVLLLQEAYRTGRSVPAAAAGAAVARRIEEHPARERRTSIELLAEELGLHLAYVPSMSNGAGASGREDRGNAILSTLPLEAVTALELPLERQRRVALAGTVRVPTSGGATTSLQLASVHLENRPAVTLSALTDPAGTAARTRQAEWLVEALPGAAATVLAGDLNTWAGGAAENAVQRLLPRFRESPVPAPGATHTSRFLPVRLDHIFGDVPGGRMSGYRRAPTSYGSDHYPMMAWIHFPDAR